MLDFLFIVLMVLLVMEKGMLFIIFLVDDDYTDGKVMFLKDLFIPYHWFGRMIKGKFEDLE